MEFKRKISNTALNMLDPELNGNPIKFKSYMLREEDSKETKEQRLGKLIHKVVLQPEEAKIKIISYPSQAIKTIIDCLPVQQE